MPKQTFSRFVAGILLVGLFALACTHFFASAQGAHIAYGETISGEISGADETDSWLFDGVRGDVVTVRVARVEGDLVPSVSVVDPDDTLLVSLEWPDQGSPVALFTVSLRTNGAHTIAIQGHGGTTGTYTLSLELQTAGQQAGTQENVLTYGGVATGAISDSSFRQFWAFRGTRGDVVDVLMAATSGDLDAYLSLLSPEGDVLASSDTGGTRRDAALFAIKLPSGGTYTVVARRAGDNFGESGTTQGSYSLALTLRSPGAGEVETTPTQLALGNGMRGRLDADAPAALYTVDARGVLSLALDMTDPSLVGTVAVMTPDRGLLGVFSGIAPMRASLTLPGEGEVWLEVSAAGMRENEPVDFTLKVSQLTTAKRASWPLQYGRARIIAAHSTLPEAWHFAGRAGDLVAITLVPFGPVTDGNCRMLAPDGSQLVQRSVGNGFAQALALGADGLYEIALDPGVASAGYQIAIELRGIAGLAFDQHTVPEGRGTLMPGVANSVSGQLSPGGADGWAVDVPEAQTWEFRLQQAGGDVPAALAVEAPDGTRLSVTLTDELSHMAYAQVSLPHPGRYQVVVFDPAGTAAHTYTLQGEPVEGGVIPFDQPAKGVLTAARPYNRWEVNAVPGTLLNVRADSLTDSNAPAIHVIGPDGLLVASTTQSDQQGKAAVLGIPVPDGGRYQILVTQPAGGERLAYRIALGVADPFGSEPTPRPAPEIPASQGLTTAAASAAAPARVVVADQIAPSITPDAADLVKAGRAETGTLLRGEVAPGALYQVWSFRTSAGQALGFTVLALDGITRPAIILMDQDGAILAEKYDPGRTMSDTVPNTASDTDSATNFLMYRFSAAATYFAVVKLDHAGRYTLRIDPLAGIDERVPEVVSGQAIGYGSTLPGEIAQPGDAGTFVFAGCADDIILAQLARTEGDLRLKLDLTAADGTVLGQADMDEAAFTAAISDFRLPADGLYRLVVAQVDPGKIGYGRFALHLDLETAKQSTGRGGGLLEGEQVAGLGGRDSTHHWLLTAQSGERVTLRVAPLTPGAPASLTIQLADTGGHVFMERESRFGQETLTLESVLLPRTGVYQAIVTGGQRQAGLYRISLERDQTGAGSVEGTIRYGEIVGGALTRENFLDVWTLAGSLGDVVTISARVVRGDPAFIGLQLRAADGQVLATIAGDATAAAARAERITLPASGYYSIVIGNPDGSFEGETAYELTVDLESTSARSMGTAIAYGQTAEGTLYTDDPIDTWLFEGQQGDAVSVRVTGQNGASMPSVSLVSTDWRAASTAGQMGTLASAQVIADQPAQIDFVVPATAPYAVVVQDPAHAGGRYRLELIGQPVSPVAAGLIRPDQTKNGQIGPAAPSAAWTFTGTPDSAVTIAVSPESRSALAPAVTLLDAGGAVLARAEATPGETAQIAAYRLPSGGDYTIAVTHALGAAGHSEGRYVLDVQETPASGPPPARTSYGQLERGVLDSTAPSRQWTFAGQRGDVLHLRAEATSGDLDPVLRLYDAQGTLIAAGDDEQKLDAEVYATLPADGDYIAEVRRYDGPVGTTSGNYALEIDPEYRFGPAPAGPLLVYGDHVSGTTDNENRSDYWTFAGDQGDVITARIQFPTDDSPLLFSLHDPAGNALATGERDRGDATVTDFALPGAGLYTLEVRRPGDAHTSYSPYLLDLALVDAPRGTPAQGGMLVADHAVTGEFTEAPATHTWIFEGKAGQGVALSLVRLRGPLAVTLTLLGPDGSTVLAAASQAGSANALSTGSLELTLDGTYTLLITGDGSVLGAAYRLLLQPATLPEAAPQTLVPLRDEVGMITDLQPQSTWTLEAQAGETLSLRVSVLSGNLKPTLMLWGPDGRPLMEGTQERGISGPQAGIPAVIAPKSGTYRVIVGREGGASGVTAGNYRLMFRKHRISNRAASALDVAFGQQVTGALNTRQPGLYAFRAMSGDVVGISVRVVGGGPVPDLGLETEQGETVHVPVMTSQDEASISAFVLPNDGRYIVAIQGRGAIHYVFTVFRRAGEASTGSLVRNLGRGQFFSEAIVDPARPTRWIFSGSVGEVLTLTVETTGDGLRADMTLYGPQGYIGSATEQPGSRRTVFGPVRLPDDGNYALLVGPWLGPAGGSRGGYTVRVDEGKPGISGSTGGYIPAQGQVVTGGLIPEDAQDVWTFDGQAGEIVTIRAEQTYGDGLLRLKLSGADGTSLAASDPGSSFLGAEISSFVLPSSGLYSIRVNGELGDEGHIEYQLAVLRAQNPVVASMRTARGIAYNQPQSGALAPGQGYQAWVFFGQAGERVGATVHPAGTGFAPAAYLIGTGGRILQANASLITGVDATLPDFTLPDNGFYGLVVGNAGSGPLASEAGYTVLVERTAAGAFNQGVLNGAASGQLTEAAPAHQWTLKPAHSGDFLVQVQAMIPGKRLNLFVLSADGEVLASGVEGERGETEAMLRLEADHLYTAVVSGGPVPGQGQYALRLMPASVAVSSMTIASDFPNIGRIDDEHPADEWRIGGSAGQTISIQVARVSGDLAPVASLLDENNVAIQQAMAGDDGTLTLAAQLPADGTYRVLVSRVDDAAGATSGDYTIVASLG
jgi:hypothetical protein